MSDNEHGVDFAYWDNLGLGWRIECLCGWTTLANEKMATTGQEFDDHMEGKAIR